MSSTSENIVVTLKNKDRRALAIAQELRLLRCCRDVQVVQEYQDSTGTLWIRLDRGSLSQVLKIVFGPAFPASPYTIELQSHPTNADKNTTASTTYFDSSAIPYLPVARLLHPYVDSDTQFNGTPSSDTASDSSHLLTVEVVDRCKQNQTTRLAKELKYFTQSPQTIARIECNEAGDRFRVQMRNSGVTFAIQLSANYPFEPPQFFRELPEPDYRDVELSLGESSLAMSLHGYCIALEAELLLQSFEENLDSANISVPKLQK
jgi:hypothetical protein